MGRRVDRAGRTVRGAGAATGAATLPGAAAGGCGGGLLAPVPLGGCNIPVRTAQWLAAPVDVCVCVCLAGRPLLRRRALPRAHPGLQGLRAAGASRENTPAIPCSQSIHKPPPQAWRRGGCLSLVPPGGPAFLLSYCPDPAPKPARGLWPAAGGATGALQDAGLLRCQGRPAGASPHRLPPLHAAHRLQLQCDLHQVRSSMVSISYCACQYLSSKI